MDAERWQRIEELFESALKLPPDEREALIADSTDDEALRRELLALLAAADKSGDFLERPVAGEGPGLPASSRIGPYRMLRLLGEGGMSRVYLAVRDDDEYQKLVALKVIRHSADREDLLRRFRTERQILAVLDHPNIARLLDGGHTDDGMPYFVMEYVEGVPIGEYCDRHRLTIGDRLELFRRISAAVQYAHQNLVVHRDIKPSNILVTGEGVPKLLDFGIAKLLKPEQFPIPVELTAIRVRPMTPYYASPEQIRGQPITTASDVYSLGVLLYELLTGHLPYRLADHASRTVEQAVLKQPPEPPATAISRTEADTATTDPETATTTTQEIGKARRATPQQLRRLLTGDLETIVFTALRKEPERRYASVEQFSEDVRRYLLRLPVAAHKDSLGYRARKFLARNRLAATASAAFVLLLVTSIVAVSLQAARIAQERDRAESERDQSEEVVAFLQDIFQLSDPENAGEEVIIAREFLDSGAARVTRDLGGRPEIQATLMEAIGNVYRNLDLHEPAEPLLRQALDIRRRVLGDEHPRTAQSLGNLGKLHLQKAEYAEAEAFLLQALELRRRLHGPDHQLVAELLQDLGRLKFETGDYAEAEALYREALRIRRTDEDTEYLAIAELLTDLAVLVTHTGGFSQAESLLRNALDLRRQGMGDKHPLVAESLNHLGVVLGYQGRLEDVEPLFREALALRREVFGDASQPVAESLQNIGRLLRAKGDFQGAEALYREAIETSAKVLGRDHPTTAEAINNLALLLKDSGDLPAAERLFRQALNSRRERLGDGHQSVGTSLQGLGEVLLLQGRPERAQTVLRDALGIYEASLPEDHWRIAATRSLIGGCLLERRSFEDAEPLLLAGYRGLAATRGTENHHTRDALERVVRLYEAWGKDSEAAEYRALRAAAG